MNEEDVVAIINAKWRERYELANVSTDIHNFMHQLKEELIADIRAGKVPSESSDGEGLRNLERRLAEEK